MTKFKCFSRHYSIKTFPLPSFPFSLLCFCFFLYLSNYVTEGAVSKQLRPPQHHHHHLLAQIKSTKSFLLKLFFPLPNRQFQSHDQAKGRKTPIYDFSRRRSDATWWNVDVTLLCSEPESPKWPELGENTLGWNKNIHKSTIKLPILIFFF